MRDRFVALVQELQNTICSALETADGKAEFKEDCWERPEGGGGRTRVIADGNIFEKGGVNTSAVWGHLPPAMQQAFSVSDSDFFAAGISLVIHPINPYVPTVHANWRYFELYNKAGEVIDSWFGGGADLTPYYTFEEDARHFHESLRDAMQPFGNDLYPKYKRQCDEYFSNKHRNGEMRGIGGVFYDYLRPVPEWDAEKLYRFQEANGNAFLGAYVPKLP